MRGPSEREPVELSALRVVLDFAKRSTGLELLIDEADKESYIQDQARRGYRSYLIKICGEKHGYIHIWSGYTQDQYEMALVEAADNVQDVLVEVLPDFGLPSNWPQCPDHSRTHPMAAQLEDDQATWVCPKTGRPWIRIGSLK